MQETTRGIFGIASMLVGVAFAALLIGHASGTAQVIQAGTGGFNSLLNTVELNGGGGSNLGQLNYGAV